MLALSPLPVMVATAGACGRGGGSAEKVVALSPSPISRAVPPPCCDRLSGPDHVTSLLPSPLWLHCDVAVGGASAAQAAPDMLHADNSARQARIVNAFIGLFPLDMAWALCPAREEP